MVIEHAQRFVAIRRAAGVPRPGYWSPPTGRLEPGESEADAVRREAHEEVGLAVVPLARVWQSRSDDGAWCLHWWRARADSAVLVPEPREVAEARWVTPAQFLALAPIFASHRVFFANHYAAPGEALRSPADRSP